MQHASVLAYARKLKIFNFFGTSDARRVNSQSLYTLVKVLRVFISAASVLSKNRQFEIFTTSIYETSIIRTLFSLNQHTSIQASCVWGFRRCYQMQGYQHLKLQV